MNIQDVKLARGRTAKALIRPSKGLILSTPGAKDSHTKPNNVLFQHEFLAVTTSTAARRQTQRPQGPSEAPKGQ